MDFRFFTYTELPAYKNALEFIALQSGVNYQIVYQEGGWLFLIRTQQHDFYTKIHDKHIEVDGVNFKLKS